MSVQSVERGLRHATKDYMLVEYGRRRDEMAADYDSRSIFPERWEKRQTLRQFGAHFRYIMQKYNIFRTQISESTGFDPLFFMFIEQGIATLDEVVTNLEPIAQAARVPVSELTSIRLAEKNKYLHYLHSLQSPLAFL